MDVSFQIPYKFTLKFEKLTIHSKLCFFKCRALQICNLTIQATKTKVYLESGEKPAEAPEAMPCAGVQVGDQCTMGTFVTKQKFEKNIAQY